MRILKTDQEPCKQSYVPYWGQREHIIIALKAFYIADGKRTQENVLSITGVI